MKENISWSCAAALQNYITVASFFLGLGTVGIKVIHSLAIKWVFLIKDAEGSARAHPLCTEAELSYLALGLGSFTSHFVYE